MSLMDIESRECMKSELDIFDVPPTQTSIESSYYVNFHPLTSLSGGGPLEFLIKASNSTYIDLQHTVLYMKSRILKKDGSSITAVAADHTDYPKTLVAPVNYFHATQFKNVEVYINSKPVNHADNLYAYRSYLETLLTFSAEAKQGQLRSGLFYGDSGDDLDWFENDVADEDDTENTGLTKRFKISENSKYFETFGRIHSEMFIQPKLLPGGNEVRIKFHRASSDFSLVAKTTGEKYKVSIDSAILMVRHCDIAAHVQESHMKALQTRNMKFPVKRVEMKFFTKAAGRGDLSEPNLVSGVLPRRIIFGLLDSQAFNGSLSKNPFNFQNFDVSTVVLRKNGTPMPYEEIDLDYTNDCSSRGYLSLIQGTGKLYDDQGFAITPEQYNHGYALYGFDLTSDWGACGNFDLVEEGKLSLEVKLKNASTKSITMVVYLEFDNVYEIDKTGNIHGNE